MPTAPYLVFGFDVERTNPNAETIIKDVEDNFPIHQGVGPLGVEQTFLVEVPPGNAIAVFRDVAAYLTLKDLQFGGDLRWFVQVCRSRELAGN
jgi:hypothetical protein